MKEVLSASHVASSIVLRGVPDQGGHPDVRLAINLDAGIAIIADRQRRIKG